MLRIALAVALTGIALTHASVAAQRLNPQVSIGSFDGNPETVFGTITDASIDENGNILILDATAFELRLFDSSGRFIASGGRRGSGPGELAAPISVSFDAAGNALVLDRLNGKIDRWVLRNQDLEFVDSRSLSFSASAMCALGDRTFVLGPYHGQTVHEIAHDGTISRSFAPLRGREDDLMATLAVSDHLWCDADGERLIAANDLYPNLYVYSAAGQDLRQITVEPFRQIVVSRADRGGVTYSLPDGGRNELIVGVISQGDLLLIQVGTDRPGSNGVTGLRTFAVEGDADPRELTQSLPRFLKNIGPTIIGARIDPYPTLQILNLVAVRF